MQETDKHELDHYMELQTRAASSMKGENHQTVNTTIPEKEPLAHVSRKNLVSVVGLPLQATSDECNASSYGPLKPVEETSRRQSRWGKGGDNCQKGQEQKHTPTRCFGHGSRCGCRKLSVVER